MNAASEKVKQWRLKNPEKFKAYCRARESTMKFRCKPNYIWHVIKKNSKSRGMSFTLLQIGKNIIAKRWKTKQ